MSKIDEIIKGLEEEANQFDGFVLMKLIKWNLEKLRPYVELGEFVADNENNVIDWAYLLSSKTQKIYADKISELLKQIREQENEQTN